MSGDHSHRAGVPDERKRAFGEQCGLRYSGLAAQVVDVGDVLIQGVYGLDDAMADIERHYYWIAAAGIVPLSAGGDHSITLPILRAPTRAHGQPLGLVHFEAHRNTGPELFGCKHHNGGSFKVAMVDDPLDPKRTIQIDIHSPTEPWWSFSYESGTPIIHIEELYAIGLPAVVANAREVAGGGPVYVSFDADGLDPVFAPGTGTPQVDGFTAYEAQQMRCRLRRLDIVGGDLVEVFPPFGSLGVTGLNGV